MISIIIGMTLLKHFPKKMPDKEAWRQWGKQSSQVWPEETEDLRSSSLLATAIPTN